MADDFTIELDESGRILDFLTAQPLDARPEEYVRQQYLRRLHFEYGYPRDQLAREVGIYSGGQEVRDDSGNPIRADIVVYNSRAACVKRDQGQILLVVECKREKERDGYSQLVSYIYNTSAEGGVWYNGSAAYYRRSASPRNDLKEWPGIPRYRETWDAIGRRRKEFLRQPRDVRGLLRICHNKLHGRGSDSDEEDLTMDIVRLLLAKCHDEVAPGDLPDFYCTPEEYATREGQSRVAARVQSLFRGAAELNGDVFSGHERIQVGDRAICDVVVELQDYQLLADLSDTAEWDLMGHAYEQYTATHLKRQRGQFFTNRLVVDFMVDLLRPSCTDIVLDPAGGSGGFLTSALRRVRSDVFDSRSSSARKAKQLEAFRRRLFMVEVSRRLVKVAKTSMILNGDGHAGMTQGDSLGPYSALDPAIQRDCPRGRPTIVFTNPPFAGAGEGRVRDASVLTEYDTGHRWAEQENGYSPTEELLPDGAPPELLFFERVLDWTAPGGRFGIVLPKSFLDTTVYRGARELLFRKAQVLAVINCHKNTFQPYTGVRTSLLFARKLDAGEEAPADYKIFMAVSRRIGQDSEGVPIFKRDATGAYTDEIDHDVAEILRDYRAFQEGELADSEARFSVKRSDLDASLRLNPQAHLPTLNETLRRLEALDGAPGWSVLALGQISAGIAVFKGPRLKSENIIVETPNAGDKDKGDKVEPYFTPSAVLQEKGDSVKWINTDRANPSQLRTISAIRVRRGDIVITRSGSIGRVAMITSRLDDAIVSDDLIRVRLPEASGDLRWYLYAYLQSRAAQDQMQMNEYGAVQQHLEPEHVRGLLVPIPDDFEEVSGIIRSAKRHLHFKEAAEEASAATDQLTDELVDALLSGHDELSR